MTGRFDTTDAPRSADVEPLAGRFSFTGSLASRAARGTLINTAFMAALGALSLLEGFILARFLSRGDYGLWGIIAASLSTLVWFKQAGIGDRFVQQNEPDQERAFQVAFTLEVLLTVVCVLVILVAIPALVAIYDLPRLVAPIAAIAGALMISVFQAPMWVYYRRMEFGRERALAAIDPVVGFVVAVALAADGAGYWAFVGGLVAGACAASAAAAWASPYKLRLRRPRGALKGYWTFSGPLLLAGATTFVMAWSALIAAKLSLGVAAIGVIALADNVSSFSERVDDIVTGALYPAICAVKDRLPVLYESFVKSNRLALMWAVPFGIGLTLFAPELVRFGIGERWHPAVVVLQVFGIAAAINHIGFNWTAYLRALDRTRPIAVAAVAATATFLATGIPLLLLIGLRGFAIGILAQGVAALVVRLYYLRRLFPAFRFARHALRSFTPAILAAGVILVLRALATGQRTVGMALAELAVYVLVTAAASWYLESELLREAVGYVVDRRVSPVVP
jgi:PST family polysaccharide transporter